MEVARELVVTLLLVADAVVEVAHVAGHVARGCQTQTEGGEEGGSKRRHIYKECAGH